MATKHKEKKVPVLTVEGKDTLPETVVNPNKQGPTMDGHKEVHQNKHQ
jgi:hypothetical protein